jgi:hypothetical protein
MAGRSAALVLVLGALVVSCSQEPPDGTLGRDDRRPTPSDPATGPVLATLTIAQTGFALHDEGNDCLAVTVDHPGLQPTVERSCFSGEHVLEATSACGWLVAPGEPSPGGCDVDLPRAFYGWVTNPGIGYVCVGTFGDLGGDSTVVSARFVPFDVDGFILDPAAPNESAVAHLFNRGGYRYGQPPLDAPSGLIYEFCEDQAPWKSLEPAYVVTLRIELAEPLRRDTVTVSLDAGLGRNNLSGGAVESDGTVDFSLLAPQSGEGLELRLESFDAVALETSLPWPTELLAILDEGGTRTGITLLLVVGAGALDGDAGAVTLACVTPTCGG